MDYKEKILQRLLTKYRRINDNGCWIFTGSLTWAGYGQLWYKNKQYRVNRLIMFLLHNFDINSPFEILHRDELCKSKACFNPEHLYIGTQGENILDQVKAKTHYFSNKTHCPRGHEYNKENTRIETSGSRRCKICDKLRKRS